MPSTAQGGTRRPLASSSSLVLAPKRSAPAAINLRIKAATTAVARSACRWRHCTRLSEPFREASYRQGARLRDRRRQRASDAVRPHDRGGERPVWPGGPQGWLGRPRVWHCLSGACSRREESAGNLVFVPALQRAGGVGHAELINKVVPDDQLDAEVAAWCGEILERSPTAIAVAKQSFNADSDNIAGIAAMGLQALKLYYETEESKEGVRAFNEKRKPDFRRYTK